MPTLAYFITFTTYGTWLHGDKRGSADRHTNTPATPYLPADDRLRRYRASLMKETTYRLGPDERACVLAAIRQHAGFRGWRLLAAHVRSNHVHMVVAGDERPERMMTEFKAYASRALNNAGHDHGRVTRWTRHGSTRWLDSEESVLLAIRYTVSEQGEPMAVYKADEPTTDVSEPRPQGSGCETR